MLYTHAAAGASDLLKLLESLAVPVDLGMHVR